MQNKNIIKSLWGGGVLFIKQFKKLANSIDNIEYIKQNIIKSRINHNIFAFSLIELSIVLIIIGLLVAGVTSGTSLIESAKIRALANEITSWDTTVNSFYALTDKLPGDANRDGIFGSNSVDSYEGYFPAPYDGSVYSIPYYDIAPFIDLYLKGIIDYEPIYNTAEAKYKFPESKILKDNCEYYFMNFDIVGTIFVNNYVKNINEGHMILLSFDNYPKPKSKYKVPFAKKLDNKIDDNNPAKGKLRIKMTIVNSGDILEDYENIDQNAYISVIAYKLTQ